MAQRWGGWYVTGTHGTQLHMGNSMAEEKDKPETFHSEAGSNVTSLRGRFDTGAYLSPHSDIVALMVLEHQTRMQNLITRVGFETRMALHDQVTMNKALGEPADYRSDTTKRRIRNAVEELLKYMLFEEEVPLTHPIQGTSNFTREYQAGLLRELELKTRLYKYRCSPLIYSRSFDSLPEAARQVLYPRLAELLHDPARAGVGELVFKTKREFRAV
ncbi:MAG: hypothetical protein WKF37_10955, partial [Bryobacteraceae bacterium]